MNLDEIRAWTANQQRVRDEYRRLPIVTGRRTCGPCITGCGRRTNFNHGYCRTCRKDRP